MESVKCKMKVAYRLSIAACLMLGVCVSSRAEAEATANPMIKSFMFRDAPIEYAMSMLGETWGRHIVVNDSAKNTIVRTFLKDIDCLDALKAVCHGHSLWYREDPESGIIYVQTVDEFAKGGVLSEKKFVEVVNLAYPRCEDIAAAIKEAYRDMVIYEAPDQDDDDEIGDISRALDRMDQLNDRSTLMSDNVDVGQQAHSSSGRGRSNSRRNLESIRGMENIRRYTDDIKRMDRYLDYTTRPKEITQMQTGSGIQTGASEPETPPSDTPRFISQSVVFLSIVRRSNSILLRSSDRDMLAQIRETIRQLDVPRPQVLLEVRILQLDVSDAKDRDIGFLLNNSSHTFGSADAGFSKNMAVRDMMYTVTGSRDGADNIKYNVGQNTIATELNGLDIAESALYPNHSVFQLLNKHYSIRLNMLDSKGKVRTLATPSLMVVDYEASRIFLGTARYIQTGLTAGETIMNETTTRTTDATAKYQRTYVGTSLVITPKVHTDGTVTLRIMQENSTALDERLINGAGGTFYETPIKKETITSAVVAKDGETIALGGLMQHEESDSIYKIPWLGDIPYLGALFRHTAHNEGDYELVVLIRPTVVKTPAGANKATVDFLHDNMQDRRNLHEALEKTREQRRANAERRLSETNPEGTNTIINAEIENKWIPTTFNGFRSFANEEMENRGAENKEAGNTDK